MYKERLIDNNENEKFCPEENIMGIELLTILYRADGNKNDTPPALI